MAYPGLMKLSHEVRLNSISGLCSLHHVSDYLDFKSDNFVQFSSFKFSKLSLISILSDRIRWGLVIASIFLHIALESGTVLPLN